MKVCYAKEICLHKLLIRQMKCTNLHDTAHSIRLDYKCSQVGHKSAMEDEMKTYPWWHFPHVILDHCSPGLIHLVPPLNIYMFSIYYLKFWMTFTWWDLPKSTPVLSPIYSVLTLKIASLFHIIFFAQLVINCLLSYLYIANDFLSSKTMSPRRIVRSSEMI